MRVEEIYFGEANVLRSRLLDVESDPTPDRWVAAARQAAVLAPLALERTRTQGKNPASPVGPQLTGVAAAETARHVDDPELCAEWGRITLQALDLCFNLPL